MCRDGERGGRCPWASATASSRLLQQPSAQLRAEATPGHAPMAAKMRAQERAPLWNDVRSYFSLGEWMRSPSSAKPTSRLSRLSSRLNDTTLGIDPPLATHVTGLPH